MSNNLNNIKLIISDFDGIFTDGGVYFSSVYEEEIKKVSFKDIMGLSIAVKNGLKVAFVSGENSPIVQKVANKFQLEDVYLGIKQKDSIVKILSEKYNLNSDEICFIGDDINDIAALELVGTKFTVADANYKVKKLDNINITVQNGGNGAFREIIDLIIEGRNNV